MCGMDDAGCWWYVPALIVGLVFAGQVLRGLGPFIIPLFAVAHADCFVVRAIIL